MNALDLSSATVALNAATNAPESGPASLAFWVRAGAGLAIGAGAVYLVGELLWLLVVINFPHVLIFRWLKVI